MYFNMNNENYVFESSCGGKRRGCCLIELPHDSEPTEVVANSRTRRILLGFSGPLAGGSSGWQAVFIPHPEVADRDSETDR